MVASFSVDSALLIELFYSRSDSREIPARQRPYRAIARI